MIDVSHYLPVIDRSHPSGLGGSQRIYRFPNGYGASVLDGPMFYTDGGTKLEVAVLHFAEGAGDDEGGIDYTTPLTDDVLAQVPQNDLAETLVRIASLPVKP